MPSVSSRRGDHSICYLVQRMRKKRKKNMKLYHPCKKDTDQMIESVLMSLEVKKKQNIWKKGYKNVEIYEKRKQQLDAKTIICSVEQHMRRRGKRLWNCINRTKQERGSVLEACCWIWKPRGSRICERKIMKCRKYRKRKKQLNIKHKMN